MDITKVLKVNQLIQIEVRDETGETERYPSRVENIGETEIIVVAPIRDRVTIPVCVDTTLNIILWDNSAAYNFTTKVINRSNSRIPLLHLAIPGKINKIQQRDFVRVPVSLEAVVSFVHHHFGYQEIKCVTRDISGGGVMLIFTKSPKLVKGNEVDIAFTLENEEIRARGKVAWLSLETDASGIQRYFVGIKFTCISEKARGRIIKYVFQRQIELRKRGLL
ncbi:MAG: flagellar brake protein [Bacillota bacterium]|uniref:Flagellar brake protein n=1 Tax=Thermanaerosceptrum fracticalcis TaxID=1712410 RepID=A0A7G6E0Z5_THEFR|nr:flagellar brake domain-containing protein [Thermanaerosceptrum fracticalcis]QNB45749.1 flagellar brake protein [Thermanaerosceptrum fracticalcis]